MAKQLMPGAELEPREGDVPLTDDEFLQLSLFAQLKRKPSLDKFPGSLVLRRFKSGEVICRQGEAGWTAFYALTTEDVQALRQRQREGAAGRARRELEAELTRLRERAERLKGAPADDDARTAARVYLAVARSPRSKPA